MICKLSNCWCTYFSVICWHCGKPAIWCHLQVLRLCSWSVCILVFRAALTSNCCTSSARGVGNCQHDSSDNLYLLSKTIFRTDLCHVVSGNVPICFLSGSDQLYQHASQLCLSMCLSCDIHFSVVIIISQLVVL